MTGCRPEPLSSLFQNGSPAKHHHARTPPNAVSWRAVKPKEASTTKLPVPDILWPIKLGDRKRSSRRYTRGPGSWQKQKYTLWLLVDRHLVQRIREAIDILGGL